MAKYILAVAVLLVAVLPACTPEQIARNRALDNAVRNAVLGGEPQTLSQALAPGINMLNAAEQVRASRGR